MLKITTRRPGTLEIEAQGKLDRADYERVVPELEGAAEDGELRVLIRLRDFEGWTPKALIDDLRFDIRHHDDFRKIAIVGERTLEKWATELSKPFFSGEMQFFENDADARAWVGA